MTLQASRAMALTEANAALTGATFDPGLAIKLLNIGHKHGAEWMAGNVQLTITRLEGIDIDLEPQTEPER